MTFTSLPNKGRSLSVLWGNIALAIFTEFHWQVCVHVTRCEKCPKGGQSCSRFSLQQALSAQSPGEGRVCSLLTGTQFTRVAAPFLWYDCYEVVLSSFLSHKLSFWFSFSRQSLTDTRFCSLFSLHFSSFKIFAFHFPVTSLTDTFFVLRSPVTSVSTLFFSLFLLSKSSRTKFFCFSFSRHFDSHKFFVSRSPVKIVSHKIFVYRSPVNSVRTKFMFLFLLSKSSRTKFLFFVLSSLRFAQNFCFSFSRQNRPAQSFCFSFCRHVMCHIKFLFFLLSHYI